MIVLVRLFVIVGFEQHENQPRSRSFHLLSNETEIQKSAADHAQDGDAGTAFKTSRIAPTLSTTVDDFAPDYPHCRLLLTADS
jgi:hypothetical protein